MADNKIMLANKCHLIVISIGFFVIFTSLMAFVGMLYHIPFLIRILPSWINIKANTALCFLLAGFALLLMSNQYRGFFNNTLLALISIIILLIGSLTTFEYVSGIDLNIDQLLLNDSFPLAIGTFAPGRMALTSAVSFILFAGVCLLSLKKTTSSWLIQCLAWLIQFIAYVSSFNYLYGADMAAGFSKYTTMAAQTNVLFILLSIAILFIKPDSGIIGIILGKNTSGYLLRRIIAIPIIVPTLVLYAEIILQKKGVIDAVTAQTSTQIMIFAITGIMIALVAYLLDLKEKNLVTAQTQIQHNQMIFQRFAENIDIVFFTTSPDLNVILYVSPAYEKIWGKSIAALYNNPKDWFESILPEDQNDTYEAFYEGLKNGKSTISANYRIKRPDGAMRNIFGRIVQVKDDNKTLCIIGIAVDTTDMTTGLLYKQLQNTILNLAENENTIHEFSPKLIKSICLALEWDLGELWLIDEPKNILRCAYTWNKDTKLLNAYKFKNSQHIFHFGEGLPGRVWEEKCVIWVPDYSSNRAYSRSNDAAIAQINSAVGIPIIYQNKVYGILNFFSPHILNPPDELLNLMKNIGHITGDFVIRVYTSEQVHEMSRHDVLTGLFNLSAMEEKLNTVIADENPKCIAVMLIDIDRFKLINESLGHACGDLLLAAVAARLTNLIDHQKNNVARLGSDKFFLYLSVRDKDDAFNYARTISNSFKTAFNICENQILVSVTIGIAIYPQNGLDGKTLMMNAELAMDQAKHQGGNRINFYTNKLPFIFSKTLAMDHDLRQAMSGNQFILEYQPQINLNTGSICAAEALVRWKHPINGLIYPNAFIPFAEKLGLIVSVNEHVMNLVFRQLSSNGSCPPISINISAQQFQNGFQLVEYIEALMTEFSISPGQIELEITESMFIEDTDHTIAVLTALHKLGFQISIDDFGSGFSSFGYLNRLPPPHKIKIDRSFISGLPDNKDNAKIVKTIIAMVHSLDMLVVAEGAETKAEVEFLMQEKCDIVQGFYYYKPMSFDALTALIRKKN